LGKFIREIGALVFTKTSVLINPKAGRKPGGSKRADAAKGRRRCGVAARNNDAIRIVTFNIHSNETTIEKRSQEGEGFAAR
jgi:hypothetical protein